jgi:hypothetical protein
MTPTDGRIGYVYKDRKGEHRWSIVARNRHNLANSGEGYKNAAHAERMCVSFGVKVIVRARPPKR